MEGFGFIAEQIVKAVRDAQERQAAATAQPPAPAAPGAPQRLDDLRARFEAELAERRGRSRAGRPAGAAPQAAPPRRQPAFAPPAAAAPRTPAAAAPPPPEALPGFDQPLVGLEADTLLAVEGLPAAPPRIDLRSAFRGVGPLVTGLILGEALAPPLSLRPDGEHRPAP